MTALQIVQDLVGIPTATGQEGGLFEQGAAEYIEALLRQRYPWLRLSRQDIGEGRFNVVAKSDGEPQLLLAGHLDTVELKTGWNHNPAGEIAGNRLYGVGSIDMKSGIACIVAALDGLEPVPGLTLLFYCDEEYDFKGMRHFNGISRLLGIINVNNQLLSDK